MSSWGGSDGDIDSARRQMLLKLPDKVGAMVILERVLVVGVVVVGFGSALGNYGPPGAITGAYSGYRQGSNYGNMIGSAISRDDISTNPDYTSPMSGYSLGSAGINSSSGANMATGSGSNIDWGSLGSAAIGLGASLYGNSQANKAASKASQNFNNASLSNAAQENQWNRENAAWSVAEQERMNKEQRQWELDNNAAINQEGRQWQLDNNERLGQEYRDWNLNTNKAIADQNQQRQMQMLQQNRPNQTSDFGSVTWSTDANGNPVQTSSLAPQLQEQLGTLRGKYGDMIGGLDSGGFGVNNDVMGAIRGLQESGLSQNEAAQRARYAAMGIPLQSTANDRGEQNLSRTRTDADLQAILAGNTAWQQGQANTRDNLQTMAGLETSWNTNMNNIPGYATGTAAQQGGFTANAPQAANNFYTASGDPASVPNYASSSLANTALDASNIGNTASQSSVNNWSNIGRGAMDIWKSLFPGDNENA